MFLLLHCPRSVGEWPDICVIQAKVEVAVQFKKNNKLVGRGYDLPNGYPRSTALLA